MKYKILVVDDEQANTRMLERALRDDYEVVCASSGAEGLELLMIHDVALIISDQRMPEMTGLDFLIRSAEMRPHCVRIILTGYTDAIALVDALNSGVVYKYITKPWVNTDLFQTIKRGLAHHETTKAQHHLKLENERLRDRVRASDACFLRLCNELQYLKNEDFLYRATRTRNLAEAIARAVRLDPEAREQLGSAAYLNSVVEIHVPNDLLTKTSELDEEERSIVRSARQRAIQMLLEIPGLEEITDVIRHQFEYYDGSLSPEGLCGEKIPLNSRIIAVAKAYDRMTSPGKSARGLSDAQARAALQNAAGLQFDPVIVDAFCGLATLSQSQHEIPEDTLSLEYSISEGANSSITLAF
ncbi:MAG TPA: HD domain-containing phosphohydrolase [Pyrinomonadaceae bacterium]|nr:HD domain-containing phosphohydrolase [Pyrinomonadaceae bacterium]